METFFNNIVSSIGVTDVLDIAIVAFLVYKVLGFIRETRAEQLAKGLVVLVICTLLSDFLKLLHPPLAPFGCSLGGAHSYCRYLPA